MIKTGGHSHQYLLDSFLHVLISQRTQGLEPRLLTPPAKVCVVYEYLSLEGYVKVIHYGELKAPCDYFDHLKHF